MLLVIVLSVGFVIITIASCRSKEEAASTLSATSITGENSAPNVRQILSWGEWKEERSSPPDTVFANTGRRLYIIGDIDGGFRPRSNVYDLYTYGEPQSGDPLANELQGVWAQPVKALDGYEFVVEVNGQRWPLDSATTFTQTFAAAQFEYELPQARLRAERTEFVAQDQPILFTTLNLHNEGDAETNVTLEFSAHFDLEDAWFTSLGRERNEGEVVEVVDGRLVARADSVPDKWAVAVGSDVSPTLVEVNTGQNNQQIGQMTYATNLAPGESQSWTMAVVVESESGVESALQTLEKLLPQQEMLLAEKQALYDSILTDGPRLLTPDDDFNLAFDVARANMQILEVESPDLGLHLYAGLEMFPFWFSNDGAYSMPGVLANNQVEPARNHLLIGARFHEKGRIPHQISPAGDIVGAGNAQETPQWVMAIWDFYRWTGDSEFLASVYPTAVAGLFDYTLGSIDKDSDGYPEGPAMVERAGMGAEKVDATAYLWVALNDLTKMAEVLGDNETAERARQEAADLKTSFDVDWWLPEDQVYADSLQKFRNTPRYDGHWTIAVPLEVGIAPPERGSALLARIKHDNINEWGLEHTLAEDDRVWTLPTATLSRGAYRYRDAELGYEMLQNLTQTLDQGSIGMFHELIPDGLSFLQLWSGATFVRGVVEDLLGIMVRADLHEVVITPQLPEMWGSADLEQLRFGEHIINIRITHDGAEIDHIEGTVPLTIIFHPPGDIEEASMGDGDIASPIEAFTLQPGESLIIGNNDE
jgi:glycogen debranching enzyme